MAVARDADILLGMHGAGLASCVYLRSTSTIIEIGHPTRYSNQHFQNLARFMGLQYRIVDGNDFLSDQEINQIVDAVEEEFNRIKKL